MFITPWTHTNIVDKVFKCLLFFDIKLNSLGGKERERKKEETKKRKNRENKKK